MKLFTEIVARRDEEPQLVLLDRPALRDVEVDDAIGRVAGGQARGRSVPVASGCSPCHVPGRYAALKSPLNRLPPSRGIMFSRTPPADVSAPMPLV